MYDCSYGYRGSQYCSNQYQRLIKENYFVCSMSGKDNCYDNVICESFFHILEVEQIHRFNYEKREQAKRFVFWYIKAYYNRIKRYFGIDYQSPINFEEQALKYVRLIHIKLSTSLMDIVI